MKLIHELWKDESEGGFTFCLSGPAGNSARALLEGSATKIWECEAGNYFEAMTKYYNYQNWGKYKSDYEQDHWPYIDEIGNTKDPNEK